ncbi:MAG: CCA tRNA nucleotidyltransferase [Actinobacteria bacterium]|nr:MAG: CCA tRNA nucleotidyltransferase [Actinomycetota bacterium]REK33554.1 MAG: CCA tRNA nucleotidyltransferase [Actinomycetota bacterium]
MVDPRGVPAQLAGLFADADRSLYLVGGSVRDAFLGRPTEDLDFTTDARPDEIRKIIGKWADSVHEVGAAFGTIAAIKDSVAVEVTTFRDEIYRDDSRKPHVSFSDSVETDLSRRDFTINSVAVHLPDVTVVDPFGGLSDLGLQILKTPMDPEISFSDDPLRMLRLFRFQATLGFTPADETLDAVRRLSNRLEIVSAERIRDELSKLLLAPEPGPALDAMVGSGLASHFLPELPALAMEQDPDHRHKDVLAHTFAVVDKASPDLTLRLAALMHDIGKPATKEIGPGGVSFHHHEVVGARMARKRLRALKYPKSVVDDVSDLVYLHLRPHTLKMGWTDSAVRRYVRDAGDLLDRLNELVRCDVTTANPRRERAIQRRIDELEERIEILAEQEELSRLRPPVDGNEVMDLLGIDPGPKVGEIMDILLEKRINDGPYSKEEAFEIATEWAAEQGL